MFDKILSNLPYNPALATQLGFYSRRMREESSIRRLGMLFMVLAFLVQFFAVISPPQPSVAASNNDIINGGISSRSGAVSHCSKNTASFATLLKHYGISCSDVGKASVVSIKSTDHNKKLYSVGRLPYGKKGETPATVSGKTYYWRYLWSWDSGAYSTYKALKLKSSLSGKTYYILYTCGNLVSIGLPAAYKPPTPKPVPKPVPAPTPMPTPTTPTPKPVPCQYNSSLPASSPQCFKPCQYNASIPASSSECKPCDQALSSSDTLACISFSKSARNPSQGIDDANGTTAQAGDTLVYTLRAQNTGKTTVKDFIMQEDLSDVLDYAEVSNLHGGIMNATTKQVVWPAQDIPAGKTMYRDIVVRVKHTIPSTPVSASDPEHFNLVMTNVYGNTVSINLPPTVAKTTEQVTRTLPNTGPGTSLAVGFILTSFVGYFFARSRLLRKESQLVLDSVRQGGMA